MLIDAGRAADALPFIQEILRAEPDHLEARCLLALAYLELGQPRKSLEVIRSAAAPDLEWPHRLQAVALLTLGHARDALRAAEAAAALAPEEPNVLHTLGRCYLGAHRDSLAYATALRLQRLAPASQLSYELLTLVALRQRQWSEAEQWCRRELELDPESWTAHNNLGLALRAQGREAEAVASLHAAVRLNPRSEQTIANLHVSLASHVNGRGMFALGGVAYLALLIHTLTSPVADHSGLLVLIVMGLLAGVVGIKASRNQRLRRLNPVLQQQYTARYGESLLQAPLQVGAYFVLFLSAFYCLLHTLELLRVGAHRAGLEGSGLIWYGLSWTILLAGLGYLVAKLRKERAKVTG
ncbi:MAG: hypothetical protein K0Q72_5146 [Armatimonadetes bacterium]|nr:hypothetical protein [Armatimonadota bacterium]